MNTKRINPLRRIFKRAGLICVAFLVAAAFATMQLSDDVGYATESEEYNQKLEELSKKQQELDEQISDLEDSIDDEAEKQSLVEDKIKTATEKITLIENYMTSVSNSIADLEEQIAQNEKIIEEKRQAIVDGISAYKQRLRVLYLAGDYSYTDVVIGSNDFFDLLMKTELVSRVAQYDSDTLDALTEQKNDYEAERENLKAQREELIVKKKDYEDQKTAMDEEIESLNALYAESEEEISSLEAQKEEYLSKKDEYDAEQADFEAQLAAALAALYPTEATSEEAQTSAPETEAATTQTTTAATTVSTQTTAGQAADEPATTAKATTAATTTTTTTTTAKTTVTTATTLITPSSSFGWPCAGYYLITSHFGARWGSTHTGMDIGNSGINGANISASRSGTVIMVNNSCTHNYGKSASCGCGWGYGNYCIIDHGDGYQTLYAHMTSCYVTVGQTVTKGETIGIVGSTGWSTGPHLHFEIRQNGKAIDPEQFF